METQLAIICACLPILRPLLPRKGWLGRLKTWPASFQRSQHGQPDTVARSYSPGSPPMINYKSSDPSYVRHEISRPPPLAMKRADPQWPLVNREDHWPLANTPTSPIGSGIPSTHVAKLADLHASRGKDLTLNGRWPTESIVARWQTFLSSLIDPENPHTNPTS